MKKLVMLVLAMMLMVSFALAQSPVLLMEMPQDAQMIENVMFDDGDFIQTYQLAGSANVHLLRYEAFDMTIDDMIASEWVGAQNMTAMDIDSIGGYPASGVTLSCAQDGADMVDVAIVMVDYGAGKLVFESVVPQGDSAGAAAVQAMIQSLRVLGGEDSTEAEVG
ncbi:MAG: hypothetical protein IJ381_07230 [Clostridia bacterium]|nr:hypothetical protein [Clostridia bacterium]